MVYALFVVGIAIAAVVLYYGVKITKSYLEYTRLKTQQAQIDLWASQLYLNDKEADLLERACEDAICVVIKRSEAKKKVNGDIDPDVKKKMAMEIAVKFADSFGVSPQTVQLLTDEMIEAILGMRVHECDDMQEGPGDD